MWLLEQAMFSPGLVGSQSPTVFERLGQAQATAHIPRALVHPASQEELPLS